MVALLRDTLGEVLRLTSERVAVTEPVRGPVVVAA